MKFINGLPPKLKAVAEMEAAKVKWRLRDKSLLAEAFIWKDSNHGCNFWKQVDDATPEQLLIIENSLK